MKDGVAAEGRVLRGCHYDGAYSLLSGLESAATNMQTGEDSHPLATVGECVSNGANKGKLKRFPSFCHFKGIVTGP